MASMTDLLKADYAVALGMTDAQLSALSVSDLMTLFQAQGHIALISGGRKIFVSATDPGAASSDNDIWIDIS